MNIHELRSGYLAMLAVVMISLPVHSQDKSVEAANQELAKAFEKAWNTHDMKVAFRKLLTDDVIWVSVSGGQAGEGGGIENVVAGHVRVHESPKFKDSVTTVQKVFVSQVRPDVAVVQVNWHLAGDRDNDGTPRPPRDGIIMWVTVKTADGWKIRAAQNTNITPVK